MKAQECRDEFCEPSKGGSRLSEYCRNTEQGTPSIRHVLAPMPIRLLRKCEVQTSTFGAGFRTRAIEGLTGAKLHQVSASGENARIDILETAEGEIPFSDFSSLGYSEKKDLADQLNRFLDDWSRSDLEVRSRTQSLYDTLIGIFFCLVGVGSLAYGLRLFGFWHYMQLL